MKNEVAEFDSSSMDYLNSHFPLCMSKNDLILHIHSNEEYYQTKSRNYLINELETLILFQIRCNQGSIPLFPPLHADSINGFPQLYFSPEEIVNYNFGDNAPQLKEELTKRGLICPK